MMSSTELRDLPRSYAAEAARGLDTSTPDGCAAARLRMAADLARFMKAGTLVRAARVAGIRHVTAGHQAAHALASAAFPERAEVRR